MLMHKEVAKNIPKYAYYIPKPNILISQINVIHSRLCIINNINYLNYCGSHYNKQYEMTK